MRIIFTGGGTGGHVIPNFAVIEELKRLALTKSWPASLSKKSWSASLSKKSWPASLSKKLKNMKIMYIGSTNGLEKNIVEKFGIPYRGVACGKLRRYFSFKTFVDIFKFPMGIFQARKIMRQFKPDVVFSKGGFVSVPVVIAAHSLGVPVILHESDVIPGLANKICARYARKICISFEESRQYLLKYGDRVIFTGNPVRKSILNGKAEAGYQFTGLEKQRPLILVIGGSQGAQQINDLIKTSADELLKTFQIVHVCGRGNLDSGLRKKNYVQYEYLEEHLKDVYAMCELVISRGGANSLAEIALLKKRALIIPLGTKASRGDQLENAKIFVIKFGWGLLLGDITKEDFINAVKLAFSNRPSVENLKNIEHSKNGVDEIVRIILEFA